MRIIVIGQAPFGRDCLQSLINQGENVVGAITAPDVPGAKKPNPFKELAVELKLPLLQPRRLRDPETYRWVKGLNPDLLVLVFVTDFVPKEVIELKQVLEENKKLLAEGKKLVQYAPVLLGVSKVALTTGSFLSSASFQETSRVLIKASLERLEDKLDGLKENVIIGKLIPAGTGFNYEEKCESQPKEQQQ